MKKYKILHITPHMGGGVGKLIFGITGVKNKTYSHKIVLLEQPINKIHINNVRENGIEAFVTPAKGELNKLIAESDIVIVHWWHHPKTAELLYNFPSIQTRVIVWTHISNITVPAIAKEIILNSTMVWLTTPASYEADVVLQLSQDVVEEKVRLVYGCAGIDYYLDVQQQEHEGFNIGYLGYVDFAKMHRDFVDFCNAVSIPNEKFILAGDAPVKEELEKRAIELGIDNRFTYLGYANNLKQVLSNFDVFGYPLMPFHTGTTENAIIEAMACKVPPVLLNQLAEKHIVKDGVTGLLVSGIEEYGNAIRYLYNNPVKRLQIGMQAREYVLNKFRKQEMMKSFYETIDEALMKPKTISNYKKALGKNPAEWFVSCLGKDKAKFIRSLIEGVQGQTIETIKELKYCSPLLKRENKGSIRHYHETFKSDSMLKFWNQILIDNN